MINPDTGPNNSSFVFNSLNVGKSNSSASDAPSELSTVNPAYLFSEKSAVANGEHSRIEGAHSPVPSESMVKTETFVEPPKNPLPISSLRSGIAYSPLMTLHTHIDPEEEHPEEPRRILRIFAALVDAGLVEDKPSALLKERKDTLARIKVREATKAEILTCHTLEHYENMLNTSFMQIKQLNELEEASSSVYFNNESAFCGRLSCGSTIEAVSAVIEGQVKNSIAVVRPPGHHAEPHKPMGFCLFNNAAIAAKVAKQKYDHINKGRPSWWISLTQTLTLGNGTQKCLYDDGDVLYVSIHRHDRGYFFPGSPDGGHTRCGIGAGLGKNVNIPWPCGGMGDGDYIYAFQRIVMPIAHEFNPDLVIVSAGFDAAKGDPLGQCYVTPPAYAHMTHMLMSLAGGKVAVILEGGYNLDSISSSALACTRVLMGEPPPQLPQSFASRKAAETVQLVSIEQSKYWKCMTPKRFSVDPLFPTPDRLHVRGYQVKKMTETWNMMKLPIARDYVSESFKDEAVCSPGFYNAETLVFFIHDAPEVYAQTDALSNKVELHKSFLLDHANTCIEWIMAQNYGLIDVNVPAMLTGVDDPDYTIECATKELCLYIWDNYIELADARNVILLGVGKSYAGLVNLISARDVTKRVKASLNFIGQEPIRGIQGDEELKLWYSKHAISYIASNHSLDPEEKVKRRWGQIKKSTMHEILINGFEDAKYFIQKQIFEDSESLGNPELKRKAQV